MQTIDIEGLEQELRGLGEFYYWQNDGNLGDYVIAAATMQLFRRAGLVWHPYDPDNPPPEEEYSLVYGGGGRFVPYWRGIELRLNHLTRSEVRRCIILPHSIFGVDSFVKSLDERHVVFCRELQSLNYCRSLNQRSQFVLAHDIGISLCLEQVKVHTPLRKPRPDDGEEVAKLYKLLTGYAGRIAHARVHYATVKSPVSRRSLAFFLRQDGEKSIAEYSPLAYDLSALWSGSCNETSYNSSLLTLMAELVAYPDVVVTDRLHVAIMAMHVGREVYMLDNDYGKLSGVYEVSLKDRSNVHLLPPGEPWPEEIVTAWQCLNAPWRRLLYRVRFVLPTKIWNFSKRVLRKLLMR